MWMKIRRALLLITASLCLMSGSAIRTVLTSNEVVATDYCTSEECKQAKKLGDEKEKASREASDTAYSYEQEVKRLSNEIAQKETVIKASIEKIDQLTKEIDEKIATLTEQKTALAEVLNEMNHNNDTELIIQIAGSKNIADLTEKQARAETVKTQIAASAAKIEETKKELEQQKSDQEVLKQGQERERNEITNLKNEQANLQAKYANDASTFAAEADEARRIQAVEEAKAMEAERQRIEALRREEEARRLEAEAIAAVERGEYSTVEEAKEAISIAVPTTGVYTNAANDTYAYRDYCPQNDGNNLGWGAYFSQFGYANYYGGYMCECVSYAGYKAYEYWHGRIGGKEAYAPWNVAWGNAISWAWSAATYGYHVSSTPVAHSIAVWPVGGVGHVQWVESVDSNYGIYISEYNNLGTAPSGMFGDYGEDYWSAYEYQSAGFSFIYFD